MKLRNVVCVGLLVGTCLTIGYAAGKITSGQDAKVKLLDAMKVMFKGEDMSDQEMNKMMGDLREVSDYMWDKVINDVDNMNEHDFAVLCSNEALQVALCAGMVGASDLYKTAAKKAGDKAPNTDKIAESMGEIAGFLLATADPQLWEKKMGDVKQ